MKEIAETYIDSFREDMASLSVLPPTHEPKATEHIDDMIALIEELIKKGYAYQFERQRLLLRGERPGIR